MWTKKSLEKLYAEKLKDHLLITASSAEPYVHTYVGDEIVATHSVGGLVTGVEPILEASRGLWIGQALGTADHDVVDEQDHIKLPPHRKKYTLRRLWISKKDLKGWYYGFANETLWPLCHNVFERPVFEETSWKAYEKVNRQFAEAILQEAEGKKAIVWIQDYHLALVASMIKEKRPDLLISQFWHIPWPIASVFQICPWRKEILEGMLGNRLIGFQRTTHCRNFLEAVSKTLEAKVDFDAMTVTYNDHTTLVRSFPISVDYRAIAQSTRTSKKFGKQYIRKLISSRYEYLAIGVERVDYIKGLPERIKAIDRFLEKYPEYQGKFTYLGVLVPSRILIKRYEELNHEIEALIEHVNFKYQTSTWQPIHTIRTPLSSTQIYSLYKSAHIAMVTSLADGMNLVAKEYIAGGPEDGALILSDQAGAIRDLSDAIIINPYDIEMTADCIKIAIEMDKDERKRRMKVMREIVAKNNVYRWAGKFFYELIGAGSETKNL